VCVLDSVRSPYGPICLHKHTLQPAQVCTQNIYNGVSSSASPSRCCCEGDDGALPVAHSGSVADRSRCGGVWALGTLAVCVVAPVPAAELAPAASAAAGVGGAGSEILRKQSGQLVQAKGNGKEKGANDVGQAHKIVRRGHGVRAHLSFSRSHSSMHEVWKWCRHGSRL